MVKIAPLFDFLFIFNNIIMAICHLNHGFFCFCFPLCFCFQIWQSSKPVYDVGVTCPDVCRMVTTWYGVRNERISDIITVKTRSIFCIPKALYVNTFPVLCSLFGIVVRYLQKNDHVIVIQSCSITNMLILCRVHNTDWTY